ncbi:MAG TPA: formylglycine-generating enzyme family protein [Phycisphaerales bacterium]|nr:formylglycine-generating enzyme family protein [Phycisphaerales bacterium]
MKNLLKTMLVLGVISFYLGADAGGGEEQDSPCQVASPVSQANDARAVSEEVRPAPQQEKTIDLGNGVTMELLLIPAGSFYMGSASSEIGRAGDEGPVGRVQITRPFYMGKHEVTQVQWKAVMGTTVRQQRTKAAVGLPLYGEGSDYPIYWVSWDEAVAFCNKLGSGFRLPTEAEWEYACRAGSDTRFHYGDDPNCSQLGQYAWYGDNSVNSEMAWYEHEDDRGRSAHRVGQKKPNAWGLYDMHGNVWEWCADWRAPTYKNMTTVYPMGPSNAKSRVIRGGSWRAAPDRCRSAARIFQLPDAPHGFLGFRIVLDLK